MTRNEIVGELPRVGPAVLSADPAPELVEDLPEVVYLPTDAATFGDELTLDLRPLEDGRVAMLLFTSLDALVAGCGDAQPWVSVNSSVIDTMLAHTVAELVLVDTVLPERLRRGSESRDFR